MADPEPAGVLNYYKPPGPTSHDSVAWARRAFGVRRIGHAGTLDPLAEGVLLLGVGRATRALEYLSALPKCYRAVLRLGIETDSGDMSGAVLSEADASAVSGLDLQQIFPEFRGEIEQVPPMTSAIKMNGQPLYRLARRGIEVERPPRRVRIDSIELLAFRQGPRAAADLRIRCGPGVYIRTLCAQLGRRLGCGGTMEHLVREEIGPWTADSAYRGSEPPPLSALTSIARALDFLPAYRLDAAEAEAVGHGKTISLPAAACAAAALLKNAEGAAVAVAAVEPYEADMLARPLKVFLPS